MTDKHDTPIFRALIDAGLYDPHARVDHADVTDLPTAHAGDPDAAHYAEKALRYEVDEVAHAAEGTRNDTLNRAAFKLGSLVSAGHLDGQAVIDGLTGAARAAGLPASEINRVVFRAVRDGGAEPRHVHLEPTNGVTPAWTVNGAHPASPAAEQVGSSSEQGHAALEHDPHIADILARYPPLDWDELWQHTPDEVQWLAYPLLERGRLYALYSPAKAGKSLVTLDMCAALATGRSVFGEPATAALSVLYVDMENSTTDLTERLRDLDYGPDDLTNLHYLSFPGLPPLDTRLGGEHVLTVALHHRADVVVIDTISRLIAGGENDADTFHGLYRNTLAPLKGAGITVLRLDHAGKDEDRGMRGSSAKVGDVDAAWKLSLSGEGRLRLDRIASRNSHSPEYVVLDREDTPLRHVLTEQTPDEDVTTLVRTLTHLGVPVEWGRNRAQRLLMENGIKVRAATLSEAIRVRKNSVESP